MKSGRLEYTPRAFNQDSQQAMRGDLVRALLELLTNADDAYDAKGGEILIQIKKENEKYRISVVDKAIGLESVNLIKHFTRIGEQNEKFNSDKGTRGLFGRGAKDITAFGTATFSAIRNGKYSEIEIDGKSYSWRLLFEDQDLSEHDITTKGFDKDVNGLKASILLDNDSNLPSTNKLIEKLQNHAQLRDLINRNEVFLEDSRNKSKARLKYSASDSTQILDKEFEIEGYSKKVRLQLNRLVKKETSQVNEYSRHGILITGRGACYENSFLHLNSRPEVGWITGKLVAPEIDELVRAIDKPGFISTPENSTRLIDRDRDGLVREHKYFRALCTLFEKVLVPILNDIAAEEGASKRESAELRKKFDSLEKVMGDLLQKLLNDSESGDLPLGDDSDPSSRAIEIIPPKKVLVLGESTSLTIRVNKNVDRDSIRFTNSNPEVADYKLGKEIDLKWKNHPRLDFLQSNISIHAFNIGRTSITASTNELVTKSEIIVIEKLVTDTYIPEKLEFLYPERNMPPQSKKRIEIIAPLSLVGEKVNIESDNGLVKLSEPRNFTSEPNGNYAITSTFAFSSEETGRSVLKATINSEAANCVLKIDEATRNKKPSVKFELNGQSNPPRRVDTQILDGQLVVRIFGCHRSLEKIFGEHKDSKFVNETSIQGLVIISEILGAQLSIYAVEREAEKHSDRFPDAASIFVRQQERIAFLVPSIQAMLIEF